MIISSALRGSWRAWRTVEANTRGHPRCLCSPGTRKMALPRLRPPLSRCSRSNSSSSSSSSTRRISASLLPRLRLPCRKIRNSSSSSSNGNGRLRSRRGSHRRSPQRPARRTHCHRHSRRHSQSALPSPHRTTPNVRPPRAPYPGRGSLGRPRPAPTRLSLGGAAVPPRRAQGLRGWEEKHRQGATRSQRRGLPIRMVLLARMRAAGRASAEQAPSSSTGS